MPDLGTPEFDEKQREAHYLLTLGMVGEIFRKSFPQVEYEYPEPPPSVISEWPLPIVAGIDTTDLEQPLRQPPVVRGARRGW